MEAPPTRWRKTEIRFGVIGAGDFAEVCHVPGLQSHPQAEVVAYAVADTICSWHGEPA